MIPRLRRILWRIEDCSAIALKSAVVLFRRAENNPIEVIGFVVVSGFWIGLFYLLFAGEFK